MAKKKYKLIDLFCGAGGLSLGFSSIMGHNFKPIWANDFNQYAADTYNENYGKHCVVGDIIELLDNPQTKIPSANVVIGGPPCQGFSLLNKNRDGDARRSLWRPFMEVVKRSGAEIFVMENVPQLLDSEEYSEIEQFAAGLGFSSLAKAKLCAADYGVPQVRYRAFIIGCKFADPNKFFPPLKTNYNPALVSLANIKPEDGYVQSPLPWRTDAISDLPKPVGTEIRKDLEPPFDLHFGRTPTEVSLRRYKAIPDEGMNRFDLQRIAKVTRP